MGTRIFSVGCVLAFLTGCMGATRVETTTYEHLIQQQAIVFAPTGGADVGLPLHTGAMAVEADADVRRLEPDSGADLGHLVHPVSGRARLKVGISEGTEVGFASERTPGRGRIALDKRPDTYLAPRDETWLSRTGPTFRTQQSTPTGIDVGLSAELMVGRAVVGRRIDTTETKTVTVTRLNGNERSSQTIRSYSRDSSQSRTFAYPQVAGFAARRFAEDRLQVVLGAALQTEPASFAIRHASGHCESVDYASPDCSGRVDPTSLASTTLVGTASGFGGMSVRATDSVVLNGQVYGLFLGQPGLVETTPWGVRFGIRTDLQVAKRVSRAAGE